MCTYDDPRQCANGTFKKDAISTSNLSFHIVYIHIYIYLKWHFMDDAISTSPNNSNCHHKLYVFVHLYLKWHFKKDAISTSPITSHCQPKLYIYVYIHTSNGFPRKMPSLHHQSPRNVTPYCVWCHLHITNHLTSPINTTSPNECHELYPLLITLQHNATHCIALQQTSTHCNTQQCQEVYPLSLYPLFITDSFICVSHHHLITSSPHHIITSSPHHLFTSSPHHLITSSNHHNIKSSQHHNIKISTSQNLLYPLLITSSFICLSQHHNNTTSQHHPAHRGDQTSNIAISRSNGILVTSSQWRGLPFTPWKPS